MNGVFWPRFHERCCFELRGRSVRGLERQARLPRNSIANVLQGHEPSLEKAAKVASALGFDLCLSPTDATEEPPSGEVTLTVQQVAALLAATRGVPVKEDPEPSDQDREDTP